MIKPSPSGVSRTNAPYRNALKHAREMNTVERKQGEASVEWLFRILERARKEGSDIEEGVSTADTAAPDMMAAGESRLGKIGYLDDENFNWMHKRPPNNGQSETATGNDENRKPLTIEALLAKTKDPQVRDRINEMMRFCEALPNVQRYTTRHHIVYATTRAFAKIYPQRFQFWVYVIRKGVDDPNHLIKHKHPVHGHIEVPNDLDLQKVKDLVEQSYKSTIPAEVGEN